MQLSRSLKKGIVGTYLPDALIHICGQKIPPIMHFYSHARYQVDIWTCLPRYILQAQWMPYKTEVNCYNLNASANSLK